MLMKNLVVKRLDADEKSRQHFFVDKEYVIL